MTVTTPRFLGTLVFGWVALTVTAADRKFTVVVVSDACTTFSERLHQANLETLHVFGWVRGTDEVIRMTQKAHAAV